MRLYRHFEDLPAAARGAVVAIGNFDGIHRGHQAVIREAIRLARQDAAPAAVLTFAPHPRRFFRPDDPPFQLTRLRTKLRLMGELGLDCIFLRRFDAAFARHSAEDFVDRFLVDQLGARRVVVGYDFVFGRGRQGSPELLRDRGNLRGLAVTVMPPVAGVEGGPDAEIEGAIYSSTGVRDCLRAGDPRGAAGQLGRPFEIEGRVRRGDARGRLIGFPTANVWLDDYLRPALGVYAVRAGIGRREGWEWHDGVANLGLRPTFGGVEPRLEVHLFDFAGDIYGRWLRVQLIDFLRPERKFDGIEALKAQIAADAEAARAVLAAPAPRAGRRFAPAAEES